MRSQGILLLAAFALPIPVGAQVTPANPGPGWQTSPPTMLAPNPWGAPPVEPQPFQQPGVVYAPTGWPSPGMMPPGSQPPMVYAMGPMGRPPARPREPLLRLEANFSYRRLFLAPILTGGLDATIGRWVRGTVGLSAGETLSGRNVFVLRSGCQFIFPVEPLHFGGGINFEFVTISRVTAGDLMSMFLMEFYIEALADVASWDRGSFFVGLRAGVEPFAPTYNYSGAGANNGATWSVSALAGVAFM